MRLTSREIYNKLLNEDKILEIKGQIKFFFPMFEKLEDFISAVEHTVWQNPKTREESAMWKLKFLKSYENYYGIKLKIPRWDEIEEYYSKKSDK